MAGRCDGVTEGVRPTGGQLHGGSPCRGDFGKVYELEDLRNITDNFSEERLLGEGGFGKVYKGLLPNGDMIAVKKLTSTMPGIKDRQFDNEVWHLMRLSHPNIVRLVGYCSHTEEILVLHQGKYVYAEKSERLLCLEYQPKGSLHDHLSDESSGLDWDSRYKIIEGICNGLHYLHEKRTPIIHMDLKPKNILLDDNMVPKIADFGLSRLFGEEQTRACTTSRDGTLGYMAPEYLNRGIITKKLDIFSLGVIIIEIMTGHKDYPYETDTSSSQEFIELVLKNWRNRLEKTRRYTAAFSIFPSFYGEIDYQRIRRCIQIGLACVKLNRVKRPTTLEILNMLHNSEGAERSNGKEDYTNERLEEVNGLYNKAEVRLNGTQNCGFSKGKKRERDERVIDPAKLHRDSLHNIDDSEPGSFKLDDMESKIAKITEKGGLANAEAVEELLRLMELDQTEQRIDLSGRVILADVIAATKKPDILHVFVESGGLLVLASWLQEAHKGKSGDGSSPKEADIGRVELLLAVLRALARLPINLSALQRCPIGRNVNHLRSHKNAEIQKKSKLLVEDWKKRIDAEMKSADVRMLVSRV
ncbi:G-type lectin S-receptor-like serine/threonine-protein kinase At1g67520 [Miscanthus floridulus]|uniref:G-type lectin S-receptor-like serine/threonine-protein kinase At1g67520 n=1 Tax=Miscanthus floridulus TaxID=154761 RepID=UPI0034578B04